MIYMRQTTIIFMLLFSSALSNSLFGVSEKTLFHQSSSLLQKGDSCVDLLRIKENLADLLIPSDADPYHLKSVLASITPEDEVSDQVVVELHQRYPFNIKKIQYYMSSLSEEGMWVDIDYKDQKRSGWEPKKHVERILELVKLYNSRQTAYFQSADLEKVIHKALHYWFTAKPVCPNWWYNQIGIPKTLGTAFILFEKKLSAKEKKEAISVMENAQFGMTGQNKVWLAGNVMLRALLQNNMNLVKMARDTIVSEILTGGEEGIQEDWSFHQHGTQQQFGNYGLSFVSGMSFFSGVFAGTSLAFSQYHLNTISSLMDEGYRWILWKGKMDISALGRQLFHNAQIHKALSLAFAASEIGGGESEQCSLVTKALLRENYSNVKLSPMIGHKHFWRSDYTVHRRSQWMATVKMASERVIGVETLNGDNMQGYYMADGATYIYKDGKEYLNIFPFWDWRKIPGVTAFQSDAAMPLLQRTRPHNETSFVGGVSDGKQGIAAMEINRAGIKARKSWIFTDDFVLCLGAGIQSDSSLVVTTSMEQCFKQGDLKVLANKKWETLKGKQFFLGKEQRFFHNNMGYILWNNQDKCIAETAKRTGKWHDVMQMYRSRDVEGDIVSLYLEHGPYPQKKAYCYLILPMANPSQIENFILSSLQIFRNDESAQVVYTQANDTYWVVAYQPLELMLTADLKLEVFTPGIYMFHKENSKYKVGCAEPTQQQDSMRLKLNNKEITVPISQNKGKTFFADLECF